MTYWQVDTLTFRAFTRWSVGNTLQKHVMPDWGSPSLIVYISAGVSPHERIPLVWHQGYSFLSSVPVSVDHYYHRDYVAFASTHQIISSLSGSNKSCCVFLCLQTLQSTGKFRAKSVAWISPAAWGVGKPTVDLTIVVRVETIKCRTLPRLWGRLKTHDLHSQRLLCSKHNFPSRTKKNCSKASSIGLVVLPLGSTSNSCSTNFAPRLGSDSTMADTPERYGSWCSTRLARGNIR